MELIMLGKKRIEEIKELISSIGLSADNYECLDLALTHSSFTFENKFSSFENNERLEFLGDAVLKLIASRYLYDRFSEYSEGELTKIRSILVSDASLAQMGMKINIGKYLKLGFHEERLGGRIRPSNIACAFEAFLGAVYLGGKYDELEKFLRDFVVNEVTEIDKSAYKFNYKAILQEYTQAHIFCLPDYQIIKEEGPAHDITFEVEVSINDEVLGYGTGKSKKEAQQKAAQMALKSLGLMEDE
jgi:ribonuclease-3